MSKILPKIYLNFDLKCFHSINVFKILLLCCYRTNLYLTKSWSVAFITAELLLCHLIATSFTT